VLKGKKIILGITGSIAAYKSVFLTRLLIKKGAEVIVIMTPAAKDFITPLTLSTVSNNPVLCESFLNLTGKWNSHIEFGSWSDLMIIAPVSANTMAKMANGIADNLLLTTYLSARCPVYIAPAMDMEMFKHPATQKNLEVLKSYGNIIINPAEGELASGLYGPGRMEEPENIIRIIKNHFIPKVFAGKKIMVTAGPTYEPIDPVRYIGNNSSGLMGKAIAEACADRGAEVTLICGPIKTEVSNSNIKIINVSTAEQMYESCLKYSAKMDITVMAAAVADYTYKKTEKQKIKKGKKTLTIQLEPTIDILSELGKRKTKKQILVGFALETENEIENAKSKLKNKNLDLIVLNSLNDDKSGFNYETNKVTILNRKNKIYNYPLKSKTEVATDIIEKIFEII
jgi:phosphopantothenoylcysteine decarboxylase / phosphopantothenate---cysteine ligase